MTKKILIVDDEPSILDFLEIFLSKKGYFPLTAKDGDKALQVLDTNPDISLIFLDIIMPNKEGIETLREIIAQHPNIPIIMMSGNSNGISNYLKVSQHLGAKETIEKPFKIEELIKVIEKYLPTKIALDPAYK